MPPPDDGKTIQVAKGAPQTFARIGRGCRWQEPVARLAMVGPTRNPAASQVVDVEGKCLCRLRGCRCVFWNRRRSHEGQVGWDSVPSCPGDKGQAGPRFGVETFVRDKPPRDCADRARQKEACTDGPDDRAAEVRRGSVQRCHGSCEPRNRFGEWGWRCSCWASSNTSRLRSDSACASGDDGRTP